MARPRTVSLPPEEMIELGKEMVAWVRQRKDTILHLSEWYTIEKMFTYNQWKTFIACEEFFPYYEQALKIVGLKYLDKNSNVRDGISQRWQRSYFQDLTERENEDMKFESSLKMQEAAQGSAIDEERFQKVINQLASNRSSSEKIAESSIISDNKS